MLAKPPLINQAAAETLLAIGRQIRAHRKAQRITAIAAAEAAGISRVTLHRIENGEPTVTVGAYTNVIHALGLEIGIQDERAQTTAAPEANLAGWIPVRIRLQDYPELKRLAWHVHGVEELTPAEALGIYERNGRHLDATLLTAKEQDLIEGLRLVLAKDSTHV
jgi:transcriptional regulator with XRE-family HTH domain